MPKTTVFFSFAHNFWPHTVVAASSALEHANNLDIHIFSDRIDERWLNKLHRKATHSDSTINYHNFDPSLVDGLKSCGHYGLATYYRLFVPDLFADKTDCLIYLDSDMVVQASLHELARKYSGDHLLSAVPGISRQSNLAHAQRLAHGANCAYFNAGLMLINPLQWKQQCVKEKCLQFFADHPDRVWYADQDMLNHTLAGQWQGLPIDWNVMVENFGPMEDSDLDNITPKELEQARCNPKIIHFNGKFKPWHFTYQHPFKTSYTKRRRSLQKTPYVSDDFPWFLAQKLARRLTKGR
jgi:lipopolysaccharide biosynthesis glycosyltransferase